MTDARTSDTRNSEPPYPRLRADAAAERDRLTARARRISNLRLLAFATGIGALVWAELRPEQGALAFGLTAIAALAFFLLVARHARITERRRWAAEMTAINDEALARIRRDWDQLPDPQGASPQGHPYARDLDVFGHASLARYFGTTGTGMGRQRLRDWLLSPAGVDVARRRQQAVRELAPMLEFRQGLEVSGRLSDDPDRAGLDTFLEWAEDEPWLLRRPWLLWLARLIPAATLTLLALHLDGVVARPWWILTLVAGTLLASVFGRRLHRLMARASLGDANLRRLAGLVERVQTQTFRSEPLETIRRTLADPADARRQLERLSWISELAELRHGGLFYVLIHLPTLWDFHVLWGLERWQRRAGPHVRGWVDAIAEIDALAALAAPINDEPGWTFPELRRNGGDHGADQGGDAAGRTLAARGLAHPLLAAGERVPNDIDVGPPGTFVMVTGSNMSGKSTLLRAIGVNVVLAQAGGPVCATSLTVPPLDVRSSMRVEDSLERGVSLFMAELQQLKRVVDAADRDDGRTLLYLLDEVLHGTNTAERQVAIREVLAHLLARPAIGAISTHDLALADTPPLADAAVPVHFRETVHPEGHDPPMSFDYQLRDGLATSTNALKLVRLVGLA